jgi:hypothetical protein
MLKFEERPSSISRPVSLRLLRREGDRLRGPQCDERGCVRTDLIPQFTMRVSDITKDSIPQPQFYCKKHRGRHPNISPTTGVPKGGDDATNS